MLRPVQEVGLPGGGHHEVLPLLKIWPRQSPPQITDFANPGLNFRQTYTVPRPWKRRSRWAREMRSWIFTPE